MMEGLVTRTTGSWYRVMLESGEPRAENSEPREGAGGTGTTNFQLSTFNSIDCRLRGNYRLRGNKQTNPVAVGDRVVFEMQDDGTGLILDVCDRRNYIVRRATKLSKQTHVIAANIDLLCVVATLGLPRTSTGFIDRLLVTAEAYHIPACVIYNKVDLYDDLLWEAHNELKAIYTAAGYPVFEVSALNGTGLDVLKATIAGLTVLFCGHSGVGKSALLNAICPGLGLKVGQISDWSLKGKHTTTFAELFPINEECNDNEECGMRNEELKCAPANSSFLIPHSSLDNNSSFLIPHSSLIIDTPGIKEFGMVDFSPQELSHFFPEMRAVLHGCRFANCTHRHEPGCAVMAAVDDGTISAERYRNYLNILDDTHL